MDILGNPAHPRLRVPPQFIACLRVASIRRVEPEKLGRGEMVGVRNHSVPYSAFALVTVPRS